MSEVTLNLVDSKQILNGTIHGSVADACIAALSAEPETVEDLEAALARYIKPTGKAGQHSEFSSLHAASEIDTQSWDAGVVVIDLAARIVAATYSQPGRQGEVRYHNGLESTDLTVPYRISDDWLFLNSITEYQSTSRARGQKRLKLPVDARAVLSGPPLLEFVVTSVHESPVCLESIKKLRTLERETGADKNSDRELRDEEEKIGRALHEEISAIHARWLMTSRSDLEGQAPRDVLLAKKEFIDFDLHTRSLQWSFQGEGPPCLAKHSFAYRFAGFGMHECVIYYDLVRLLLWSTLDHQAPDDSEQPFDSKAEISWLEHIKDEWLESPQDDYGGRIPAILIENERKRMPITLQAKDMIVDENCEICVMSARQVEMGYGPGFWHLDGSNMDDGFAFSFCRTREEWDEENRRREEFDREFELKWKEREERLARGELVDDESYGWVDSFDSEPLLSPPPDADDESKAIQ